MDKILHDFKYTEVYLKLEHFFPLGHITHCYMTKLLIILKPMDSLKTCLNVNGLFRELINMAIAYSGWSQDRFAVTIFTYYKNGGKLPVTKGKPGNYHLNTVKNSV